MKRHGNLFDKIASFENLLAAEKAALRSKRRRPDPAAFHFDLEPNLFELHDELQSGTYRPGEYRSFWIRDPKRRLISAAPYRDRVVHHAVCRVVEPIFDRTMIFDSYANRMGKGTNRLFAEDKTSLHDVLPLVRRFLEGYRLRLHPRKCVVLPVRWGVPFLGWRLYPDHRRLRRSTGVRFQRRLRELAAAYGRGEVELADVRASVASWIGHLKHGNTWGLRRKLLYGAAFRRVCPSITREDCS